MSSLRLGVGDTVIASKANQPHLVGLRIHKTRRLTSPCFYIRIQLSVKKEVEVR